MDAPVDDPGDAAALAGYAAALAQGIEAHLAAWVERVVAERHRAWGGAVPEEVAAAARAAGRVAVAEVGPQVRDLLDRDVDAQATGPLALLRAAAVHPTRVLRDAGVPPVERDPVAVRIHPDDVYDLGPASFADVHPDLHEPGLTWGAAKAHVILARRRREGLR
ncbi:hypothetical protein HC251_03935 [Iamia sp. SCSIO 61187]|uniref:hypothetical protein n=1 Tax=Iamia sp. SCSIO 61187 TaxID=2722752 RepID=UPI001C626884|nr:hypothetical protein [Iamia sp. SCSIO 61187]QYG91672.1 hypothetical protein HC251_03935 [Iamia sp. SCSIO 61187]